jgi:LPXTG-motif cell wall-anchored protein
LFWNLPTSELRGVAAAAGIAAINSVGNFAGFVSPFVIGWVNVRTGTPQAGLVLLGAALLAGAALVLGTGRRRGGRQSAIPDAAGGERR